MPFNDIENKKYDNLMKDFIKKHRPPINIRDQVDLNYRINNYSIEIFEIRPRWNKQDEKIECPIAKTTYVKKNNVWKIFWQRADLKWHGYDPVPAVSALEEFFEIVEKDQYGCFKG